MAADDADTVEEVLDPTEELRSALKRAAGDWYVVHSYAGYENKVKTNLETRIKSLDMEEYIFQIEVPTEEVTEIKNGQRKQVQRKVYPGYILVRMDLTDGSWSAVRNTPGVTGFVGATAQRPSALSIDEVVKILTPTAPRKSAAWPPPAAARRRPAPRSTSRSASRSPSWTARSPRCRRPSTRSTPTRRSSRCWSRSSAARLPSSSRSPRSPRSDPTSEPDQPGSLHSPDPYTRGKKQSEMPPKKKKLAAIVKLQIKAGMANPAPPVGPALGQHGVNIMEFCKAYNAATESQRGDVVPVEISIYEDRSFDFKLKTPPAARLLLKAAGVEKGSGTPHTTKVASVSAAQLREIATLKQVDLNANDIDAASKIIAGTARSMGITITD